MDLWPFLLCGSLLQLNSAHDGLEPLQQRKAVCSQNMCSAQIQSVPGCQAAVSEARPLPVIINPFAAPALSSHLALSGAAPSLCSWETGKGSSSSWGWGAGRMRGSGETWRKEGPGTQPEGAITSPVWTGAAAALALWCGAEGAKWV